MAHAYIDTNMLTTLAQGTNVLDQLQENHSLLEPTILEGVIRELEALQETGTGAEKRAAKLAKAIITQQDLKTVSHSPSYVDDALLALATSEDAIVTLDKELIKRARKQGLRVLTLANRRLRWVA